MTGKSCNSEMCLNKKYNVDTSPRRQINDFQNFVEKIMLKLHLKQKDFKKGLAHFLTIHLVSFSIEIVLNILNYVAHKVG